MNLIPGFIGVSPPVLVPDMECVQCGGSIVEGARNIPRSSDELDRLVAHYEAQRWCTNCGGMVYQRLESE